MMGTMKTGPAIEELTRHMGECPEIFLAEPLQYNGVGEVDVRAVVADLLRRLGQSVVTTEQLQPFTYSSAHVVRYERNRLRLILLACWLCTNADLSAHLKAPALLEWLAEGMDKVANLVSAEQMVSDPERREELARLCLANARLLPLGEGPEEAENKLDSVSSVKRDEVVRASAAAEKRAQALRREMAAAEQAKRAAANYNRE